MQQTMIRNLPGGMLSISSLDLAIHVESYGNPEHPPILFLHGLLQSGRCWRKQIPTLSQRYHLIIPDLPGHGFTSIERLPGLTPQLLADVVHTLLTFYDPTRKGVVLVGASWGGSVMRSYLLAYGREAVRGLVLIGTSLDMSSWSQEPEVQVAMAAMGEMYLSAEPDVRARAFLRFHDHLTLSSPSADDYYVSLGYNALCFLKHGLCPALMQPLDDPQHKLYKSLPPTLIIQGEQDALCNVAIGRQEHLRIIGSHYLEYVQCGHSPFLEYPEKFNEDIQRWMHALN